MIAELIICTIVVGLILVASSLRKPEEPPPDVFAKAYVRVPELPGCRLPLNHYVHVPNPRDPRVVMAVVVIDGDEYEVLAVRPRGEAKDSWEVDLHWKPKAFSFRRLYDEQRKGQA